VKQVGPEHLLRLSGNRLHWLERRRHMEAMLAQGLRNTLSGTRPMPGFVKLFPVIRLAVGMSGLQGRGRRNAAALRLTELEMRFDTLPPAFEGYRILFLSDLHVDALPATQHAAERLVAGLPCDLVVLGGDYQSHGLPVAAEAGRLMAPLLSRLAPVDGVLGVLGNHDSHDMAAVLERLGVRMLLNERTTIERAGQSLHVVGTDDPHCFYEAAAGRILTDSGDGFRIALVHTPELADVAAAAGFALYLAGHTHGGQICLPGGRPVFTALDSHHPFAKGAWRHHAMQGYTTTGIGAGAPTVRFNSQGEVCVVTLRRISRAMG
jgi:predicted MPP superfamily phosphohydrolase